MFSYYGSKSKIAHLYPKPRYDSIVEPFAGSARYALLHFEKEVTLVDKFHKIVAIWHYLQQASSQDILSLPVLAYKESLNDHKQLSEVERWFLGFLIARGSRRPNLVAQKYNNVGEDLKRIAAELYKIKHWRIIQGDYADVPNKSCTWFIDPPYTIGGEQYSMNKIDYPALGAWCKEREGQIIVCENTKATWLPFAPLISTHGAYKRNTEAIWCNTPLNTSEQIGMFL